MILLNISTKLQNYSGKKIIRIIEGKGFCEISGHAYQTKRCHIPEGSRLRIYICSKTAGRWTWDTWMKDGRRKTTGHLSVKASETLRGVLW